MKNQTLMLVALVLVSVVAVSGCTQGPSESTSNQNQASSEPKTQMELSNNGFSATLFPTVDSNVKGVVTLRINSVPSNAVEVWLMVFQQGQLNAEDPFKSNNTVIQTTQAVAGKDMLVDTTRLENGVYNFNVMTKPADATDSNPWSSVVMSQIQVDNRA